MRYLDVPEDILRLFGEIRDEYFPHLVNCSIKILMDTKPKKKDGNYIFGRIKKSNEVEKFLSDGYDYIMFLDSNLFDNIDVEDQKRIIRHELRHTEFDPEKNDPYRTVDHDVQDFRAEIELNKDDPDWGMRVSEIAHSIYSKE